MRREPLSFPYVNVSFFLLMLIMGDLALSLFFVMLLAFLMIHALTSLDRTANENDSDSAMAERPLLQTSCQPAVAHAPINCPLSALGAMLSRIQSGGEISGATTAKAWLRREADMLSRWSCCLLCPEQNPRKHGTQRRPLILAKNDRKPFTGNRLYIWKQWSL